jgi:hypothetical protein
MTFFVNFIVVILAKRPQQMAALRGDLRSRWRAMPLLAGLSSQFPEAGRRA